MSAPQGPLVPTDHISTKTLLKLVIVMTTVVAIGTIVIFVVMGDDAKSVLIAVNTSVTPLMLGLLGVLLKKLAIMEIQVNGITHELIKSRVGEASAEATVAAQDAERVRTERTTRETEERYKTELSAAEARMPETDGPMDVHVINKDDSPVTVTMKENSGKDMQ